MSEQPNRPSDIPWDRRPVTIRDLGIALGLFTILFFAAAALIAFPLSNRAEPTAAGQSAVVATDGSAASAGSAGAGQAIFQAKCTPCHSIGGGVIVGPDLQGVTERRDAAWLNRWIAEPDKMLAEGDPIAAELLAQHNNVPMPNPNLTAAEVQDVISYLANPSGGGAAASAIALPLGDPQHGRTLFTGGVALENGGPPCISCHSATGIGPLGGGTLGPDLTNVYERYGDAGLPTTLQNLPFPTMQGVFGDKPLTEDEAADLFAFFAQTNQSTARAVNYTFLFISLAGFGLLILLGRIIWRRRLKAVRKPLLGGTR